MADYSLNLGNEFERAVQASGPSRPWSTNALYLPCDESTNTSTAADRMRTAEMTTRGWGLTTAHSATKTGTVTLGTAGSPLVGAPAYCARFAGSGVLKPADTGGDFNFDIDDVFTVNVFARMTALSTETALVSRLVNTTTWKGWMLSVTSAGIPVVRLMDNLDTDGARIQVFNNNNPLTVGDWFMLTFTYDGSTTAAGVKIYIQGLNAGTSTVVDSLAGGDTMVGGTLRIGAADDSFVFGTSADIAAVFILPRVISPARILEWYNQATNAAPTRVLAKNAGWLKNVLAANLNSAHFICGDSTSMPGTTSLATFLPFALKNNSLINRIMAVSLNLFDGYTSGGPYNGVTLVGGSSVNSAQGYVGIDPGDLSVAHAIFDSVIPASSGRMFSLFSEAAGSPTNIADGSLLLAMAGFYDGTKIPGADLPAATWDKLSVNFPVARLSGSTTCVTALTLYAARGGQYIDEEVPIGDTLDGVFTFRLDLPDSATGDDVVIGFGVADGIDETGTVWAFAGMPLIWYNSSSVRGAWFLSPHARAGSWLLQHSDDTYYTVAGVLADNEDQLFGISATWSSTTAWGCLGINDCKNYSDNLGGTFPTLSDVTDAHYSRAKDFVDRWNAADIQVVIIHPWRPATVPETGVVDAAWDGVADAIDATAAGPTYAAALNINGVFANSIPDFLLESIGVHLYDGAPSDYGVPAYRMWVIVLNEIMVNVLGEDTPLSSPGASSLLLMY